MNNTIKNILRNLWDEFVYGAHLTALASAALVLSVIILLNIEINLLAIITAYLTTFIVYSFNYLKELDDDILTDPSKVSFLNQRINKYKFIISAYIILDIVLLLLSFSIYGNFGFIIFILILLSGGILYTIVFKVLTKYIPGFKSIYCTGLWAYAGTFYVTFFYSETFSLFYGFMFIFMFMKLLINAIFFDIKDMNSDKKNGLKTIPILLGKSRTILLLTVFNILSLIILFYSVYANYIPTYGISLAIFSIYTEYYLLKGLTSDQKDIVKYTYVMADAEFIFWPLVIFIGKILFLK
jgi:4-hydroxybenzoate polyprenyltransferase